MSDNKWADPDLTENIIKIYMELRKQGQDWMSLMCSICGDELLFMSESVTHYQQKHPHEYQLAVMASD